MDVNDNYSYVAWACQISGDLLGVYAVIKEISAAGLMLLAAQAHAIYKNQPADRLINKDYPVEQLSKTVHSDVKQVASVSCQTWMAFLPAYLQGNDTYVEIHRLEGLGRGFQCN
ncbi:hypothetical protein IAE26_03630 [Delftia sp. S67]|nr:hypothetical protein [Delftia sp. S65]MBK0116935.1 hypothetical protein [Delftia sp. S67]MBK0128469.1 hypothetical protein [Delftia sp. S66]MBO0988112.1 hypothetical protein [Delftia sp. SD083]